MLALSVSSHDDVPFPVPSAGWTGVEVVVDNLTPEQWGEFSVRIHGLGCPFTRVYAAGSSRMFLDSQAKGQVYSHGIYVCTDPALSFGYDLADLALDVDRKVPSDYDLKSKIAALAGAVLGRYGRDTEVIDAVMGAVSEDAVEFEYLKYNVHSDDCRDAVADYYRRQKGDALPVPVDEADAVTAGPRSVVPMRYFGVLESAGVADRVRLAERSMAGIDPMLMPSLEVLDRLRDLRPVLAILGDTPKLVPSVFHGGRAGQSAAFVDGVVYLSETELGTVRGALDAVLEGLALAQKRPVLELLRELVYAAFVPAAPGRPVSEDGPCHSVWGDIPF